MDNKKESYLIPRRNFLKEAGLVTGGAVASAGVLPLGGCSSAKYACPYCSNEPVFGNAADLKAHIHEQHAFNNVEGHVRTPVPFCISFGSIQDRVESPGVSFMSADDNIQRHLDELEKRGWPTNPTLEMPTDLTVMSGAKLKHLGDIGCEMALDVVRLWIMDREGVSYADQLAYVRDLKDELEQATGTRVRSARRPFSSHDKHTYAICEEVGITWYHLSPYYHYLPFQATAPFKHPEYNIVICPRPSLHLYVDAGDVVPVPDPVNAGNYF